MKSAPRMKAPGGVRLWRPPTTPGLGVGGHLERLDLVRTLDGSPRLILSTLSMPSMTLPHTVYCLSRKEASSKQMKNWLLALSGEDERAIEHTPRTCGSALNSPAGWDSSAAGARCPWGSQSGYEAVDDAVKTTLP
jgi:hypothetical protein